MMSNGVCVSFRDVFSTRPPQMPRTEGRLGLWVLYKVCVTYVGAFGRTGLTGGEVFMDVSRGYNKNILLHHVQRCETKVCCVFTVHHILSYTDHFRGFQSIIQVDTIQKSENTSGRFEQVINHFTVTYIKYVLVCVCVV